MKQKAITIDGNEAAAYIAYRVNEVCAIYPITPSSPMAEHADVWSAKGVQNIWGQVPEVIEMQSEGGAAGTVHGALQTGALTTTFTASQGLMLMLPNMYKIAGELTSTVFHVAARSLAAQGLSIFGDHSDVMAARTTGFAMLASSTVQEAHDQALIAQSATLRSRIPFIHFFDGFRTSHEVNKIKLIDDVHIKAMIHASDVYAHRQRGLNPDHPVVRGTAQNPDVYFQGRETVNRFYNATPVIVQESMDRFAKLTGRQYKICEYAGVSDAEHVIVVMGSAASTVRSTVHYLNTLGEKVGMINIRLYRPFSAEHLLEVLPSSVLSMAILDRTKEPGAPGEPLYQDVVSTMSEAVQNKTWDKMPLIVGGRYGLSSKEFTPGMVCGIFESLKTNPKNHFTIGINDDVTHTSLQYEELELPHDKMTQALFFGLGADGTVGANKNSIKIIGENTELHAQGYFVYDSKKAGTQTVSHLRFGEQPIEAPYLIRNADFIACHKFNFISKVQILPFLRKGGTFLLNSPFDHKEILEQLPAQIHQEIIEKEIQFYVIDASRVARENGMGTRINTIMQVCFFALSGILPKEQAIAQIKAAIHKSYSKKGEAVVQKNFRAVDAALSHLQKVEHNVIRTGTSRVQQNGAQQELPEFVRNVTMRMMEGKGNDLPVSLLPADGTYPPGTTKLEKRNISDLVAVWQPDLCIQCGNCSFVCPHSVIRAKFFHKDYLMEAPETFDAIPINARGFPETRYRLQVYLEDCTGCNLCVEACPAISPVDSHVKAINMQEKKSVIDAERKNIQYFEKLPYNDRTSIDFSLVRGAQYLEPLFEFSGACAGCGETPYLKLLSQLFGDRLLVANATGCSSIYGGNLPTTPWTTNADGKGPAWSNSLFEDNAEFGLGMRISVDQHMHFAKDLLEKLSDKIDINLIDLIINATQRTESELTAQRERIAKVKVLLLQHQDELSQHLLSVIDHLVRRSVWLVGGDGWAYDIGSGGLDHALASGKDINVLVLDTEVYSNTGGQMSKATPTAATAKFASAGKKVGKKDLALQAISYGNVYVAQIAMGADPQQTLLALREAEAYPGPSLILAYSHCIEHGINMEKGLDHQAMAVASGYWPLIRYNPVMRRIGKNPFILDSPRPTISFKDYAYNELRYKNLQQSMPEEADRLMRLAQEIVDLRWKNYENMVSWKPEAFQPVA